MTAALVAAIGLAGGVVSGLFGIGGAVVMVPALVLFLKTTQHTANGTSLAALLLPVGILGVMEYYRRGEVVVHYAVLLAVGLFVGVLLGAKLAGTVPDLLLRRAFGVLLLLTAVRMLVGR